MKKITLLAASMLAGLAAAPAQAHIVGLGWTFGAAGEITFDALHWHGSMGAPDGELIVDGTSYAFTSFTNDAGSMTGLDGALTNPTYSSYDGAGTLTATNASVNDWLHVTIAGLAAGAHTVTAPNHPSGLTDWTLSGGVTSFNFNTPPPTTAVAEPTSLALLGLGLVGLGLARRQNKKSLAV